MYHVYRLIGIEHENNLEVAVAAPLSPYKPFVVPRSSRYGRRAFRMTNSASSWETPCPAICSVFHSFHRKSIGQHASLYPKCPSFSFGHPLGLLDGFVNRPDVHERPFGQRVVLAVADLLEAADRIG